MTVAAALSGCSSGGDVPPPPTDGGHHGDAAVSDLGFLPDGAPILDSGGPPTDAGPSIDSAPPDDGLATDAGDIDAVTIDAGTDLGPISMPCTAAGTCDPFDVTSCPSGQSCRPDAIGNAACQTLGTTVHAFGEVCTAGNDCAPGTLCLDFGGGLHCEQMCPMGSIGFCSGENRCNGTLASSGTACIQVCRPRPIPCNIYTQDCADAAYSCAFATDPETRAPYTGCRLTGTVLAGGTCGGTAGACARGLVCINESGVTACHQVCGPDAGAPTCAAPETCTGLAHTWGVPYCR